MTNNRVDVRPPRLDGTDEQRGPSLTVTTEFDPPPMVRAVATRLRVALRSDSARQALETLPAEVELRSDRDLQCARLARTPEGVHVDSPAEPVALTVSVDPVALTISVGECLPDQQKLSGLSALLDPEPPLLADAAREFWRASSGLSGMPGLTLVALDTGEIVRVGPDIGAYEIHGTEMDLRRVMAGLDLLMDSVRAGKFYIKGSHRQLSVLAGASMKAVLNV